MKKSLRRRKENPREEKRKNSSHATRRNGVSVGGPKRRKDIR